jgi:hypothetical protein
LYYIHPLHSTLLSFESSKWSLNFENENDGNLAIPGSNLTLNLQSSRGSTLDEFQSPRGKFASLAFFNFVNHLAHRASTKHVGYNPGVNARLVDAILFHKGLALARMADAATQAAQDAILPQNDFVKLTPNALTATKNINREHRIFNEIDKTPVEPSTLLNRSESFVEGVNFVRKFDFCGSHLLFTHVWRMRRSVRGREG